MSYTTSKKARKDWNFESLKRIYQQISTIAEKELTLDLYPNQIEIITFEQMLDAYSSIGMPLMYQHWSFGKNFARDELLYRHGLRNLAYEIVINSNPVHILSHGGKLHDDADFGDCSCGIRP